MTHKVGFKFLKLCSIFLLLCLLFNHKFSSAAYHINNTLNYYYKQELVPIDPEEEYKSDSNKRLIKVEETIDYNCVKEKLNLPENGEIVLPEAEARILIASAKSKCIKVDPVEFSNLFIDFAIERGYKLDRYYVCAKFKLQELEPTSKLAVTSSSDELHKEHCSYYDINLQPYSVPTWTYKEQVGRLNETTCGVVTDEFEDLISLKTVLVFDEQDKELKVRETMKLFNEISEKLQKLSDCILKRIK